MAYNISNVHGLVACGGDDGAVECFDMRTKSSVGRIDAVAPAGDIDPVIIIIYLPFTIDNLEAVFTYLF